MDGQGCIYKILYTLGMAIRSGVSSGFFFLVASAGLGGSILSGRGRLAVSRAGLRQRLQGGVASGLRQSSVSQARMQACKQAWTHKLENQACKLEKSG